MEKIKDTIKIKVPMLHFLSALTQTVSDKVGIGVFVTGSLSESIAKVL